MINWKEVHRNPWEDYRVRYDIVRSMNEFLPIMQNIALLFKPHTYMELGLRHGWTFNQMTSLDVFKRAVGVELDTKRMRGVKTKNRPVEIHNMSTDEFAMLWSEPIDMLFIDADHSFKQAKKDFDNFSKWMSPCGIICMHDTYPTNRNTYDEAWKLARAIHKWDEYKDWEIFTFPGTWAGLSLVRKAVTHLHYLDEESE
ncbi:MAG: hypothetical protein DRQ42_03175 [Gammaproteobacteria bacterium]|nr:MAG: hypothetical protein DRQ42_03175 [Gammaproteobacteria bacterium]